MSEEKDKPVFPSGEVLSVPTGKANSECVLEWGGASEEPAKHTSPPLVSIESLCGCAWSSSTPIVAAGAVETTIDVRCPTHGGTGLRVRVRLPGVVNTELLEACKECAASLGMEGELSIRQYASLRHAKAAIAKAEGR